MASSYGFNGFKVSRRGVLPFDFIAKEVQWVL